MPAESVRLQRKSTIPAHIPITENEVWRHMITRNAHKPI
ncbi:hypothetical protein ABID49_001464 [Bhargavaea ullalensis]|uniref:Uncharacterized protein n=1 Tax=Bhargavaea ullalensis TaxID=1265685 RepID=A0ABV2GBN5_9BACL